MKEYYKETIDWSTVKEGDPVEIKPSEEHIVLSYFVKKVNNQIYHSPNKAEIKTYSGFDYSTYCRPLDKSCIKQEVDWSKVPVDAKVIDLTTDEKTRYHFSGYYEDKKEVHLFKNGKSSWTNGDQNTFWLRRDEVELVDNDNVSEK